MHTEIARESKENAVLLFGQNGGFPGPRERRLEKAENENAGYGEMDDSGPNEI